jgi:hypothetical protein
LNESQFLRIRFSHFLFFITALTVGTILVPTLALFTLPTYLGILFSFGAQRVNFEIEGGELISADVEEE